MDYKNLKISVKDRIATVTISRPKALNALNVETLEELIGAFEDIEDNSDVSGVILTGEGEKAFVAGADISEMLNMGVRESHDFAELGQETFHLIESLEKPVVAAVNGYALGGGMEIAMSCDIILAGENARFGQPEVKLGVIPGFGGTQRLVRRVGGHIAKEIIFSGLQFNAQRAMAIGLVSAVYPPAQLIAEAEKLMKTILSNSAVAVGLAKHAINRGADLELGTGLLVERDAFSQCFASPDQKEGMMAFIEKRPPKFS